MDDKKTWPVVLGVAAGIIGGVVAGLYIYSINKKETNVGVSLRTAQEIIEACHSKIKEIEAGLKSLKEATPIQN
ncbi:MAG: hypothetical protein K6T99_10030 [Armatimonadetes bacterium]|nr:hypothetical protein [Armatimonadota bacterium]